MMSLVGGAPSAFGQAPPLTQMGAPVDTVSGNVPGIASVLKYDGGIKGNVTKMSLGNRFMASFAFPSGLTSITTLSADESKYRLQDREDTNKSFSSNLVYPAMPGLIVDGSVSDTRFFNRVITFSNASQDLTNNVQRAQGNATYARPLGWGVTFNAKAMLAAGRSEQTYYNDNTKEGGTRFGLNFTRGRWLSASAKGFYQRSAQDAESGLTVYKGLGAEQDSVLAQVRVARDSASVAFNYERYQVEEDYLELPRGSFGQQQFDEEVVPENTKRHVRSVSMDAEMRPLPRVQMRLSVENSIQATYYAVNKRREGKDHGETFRGNLGYRPFAKSTINFDFEYRNFEHYLGPERTGSYDDIRKNVKMSWNQGLSETLRFTAQAGVSLTQSFYWDTDRDRDQRYQFANVRLTSDLFSNVDAAIYMSGTRTDYVNVRASLSQNNRTETRIELRPEFTWRINERIELRQKYGLNIEYSDFLFQEDENFLDRTITFANTLRTRLLTNLMVDFYYAYQYHSKGSYLSENPDEEKVLDVSQEDRRDEMKIGFRYQMTKHMALVGLNEYSRRTDLISTTAKPFEDGGVELGVEGKYDFGAQRGIKVALTRVKRFGRFNADAQKDYWEMDSSITYTF
jgi:hypothetical protein